METKGCQVAMTSNNAKTDKATSLVWLERLCALETKAFDVEWDKMPY